jgi:hypothetical protein
MVSLTNPFEADRNREFLVKNSAPDSPDVLVRDGGSWGLGFAGVRAGSIECSAVEA